MKKGLTRNRTIGVTMADVAKHAGVSAATVARVIYKNGYVKRETRAAVEAAIKEIEYRPSLVARSLRTSRSFTMGMVVSESNLNAFPPAVAQVIQLEALKHGYTVLTLNNQNSADMEAKGVRRFLDHHVDVLIFCTAIDPANVRYAEGRGTPTVQIERATASLGNFIGVDPADGIRVAVEHLFGLGHRSFAYLGGSNTSLLMEGPTEEAVEPTRERLFVENLERLGISVRNSHIRRAAYHVEGKPPRQPAVDVIEEILRLAPRPTALVCGSDLLAAAALQGLSAAGLSVPRDISVVGFDDTLAEILTPPLSSIAQPVEDLGRLAVDMAMAAINDPAAGPRNTVVPAKLVLRASTGPAPLSMQGT